MSERVGRYHKCSNFNVILHQSVCQMKLDSGVQAGPSDDITQRVSRALPGRMSVWEHTDLPLQGRALPTSSQCCVLCLNTLLSYTSTVCLFVIMWFNPLTFRMCRFRQICYLLWKGSLETLLTDKVKDESEPCMAPPVVTAGGSIYGSVHPLSVSNVLFSIHPAWQFWRVHSTTVRGKG